MTLEALDPHIVRLVISPADSLSAQFAAVRGHADVAPDAVVPGTEALLLTLDGVAAARASVFVAKDMVGAPGPSGLIGHYEAINADVGRAVLEAAHQLLAERGVRRVVGPMNGSTWMRYRLALPPELGDHNADACWFAGEPSNAMDYAAHWQSAGFTVAQLYESRSEALSDQVLTSVSTSITYSNTQTTVRIRCFEPDRFDEELEILHRISLDAFAENRYYAPIDLATFRALYAPFRGRLDASFVLLAERSPGEPVGFVFAYADPNSVVHGRPTRLIVKTLATARSARGERVSSALLDAVRTRARAQGFQQVISALMHADNATRRMAERRDATLFRRYALFERGV